jgi:adenosylhomocysteinase
VDPIKVLEAIMEGYQVLPMAEAAAVGDVFVTVTGNRDAIRLEHMEAMKSGAIVCNSGHFDVEIDLAGLRALAAGSRTVRPDVVEYALPDGRRINVLAEGRLVGQACAEAHPAEVMDLSFSTQALAVEYLVAEGGTLEPAIHSVPPAISDRVARHKLRSVGVRWDDLTEPQLAYLSSWRTGT